MVNQLFEIFNSLTSNINKSAAYHIHLQKIIENTVLEANLSSTQLLLDISTFEEIATLLTELLAIDQAQQKNSEIFASLKKTLPVLHSSISLLKLENSSLEFSVKTELNAINKLIAQTVSVHKEYKSRCQFAFLDFLKGVDVDLRKILKPLVPCSVIREQIKYPLINTNPSLRSSMQSVNDSVEIGSAREAETQSQPEPAEVTVQKLSSHIQMLVTTLENIAKDLIQVLAEADREYYQLLNQLEVFSRPPTPLAAPLPDYFCYELQETPREIAFKQILTSETKEIWIKRLKKLKENNEIVDSLYKSLMDKLKSSSESKKVDLKDMFVNSEVPIVQRESLVYYLINGSTEFDRHVSISQMLDEGKHKPEPPKVQKPKGMLFSRAEKESERRVSPLTPDQEVARISQITPVPPQVRIVNSIRLTSKSPKLERFLKNRKSVRVRSITPVGKEKSSNGKLRTPSVNGSKVSYNTLNTKHRLRKNL